MPLYPVALDLVGASCLVVGGGPVAARRTRGLLLAGAVVTLVAPELGPAVGALAAGGPGGAGSGTPWRAASRSRPVPTGRARPARYRLVVAATGLPGVDSAVVADALGGGTLVTLASGRSPGTLQLPAVHRAGPVTLTVSTGGTSPALAGWLRDRAAAALGPEVAVLAALVEEARASLRATGRPAGEIAWREVFDRVAPLVDDGRTAEARALLARLTRRRSGLSRPPPPGRRRQPESSTTQGFATITTAAAHEHRGERRRDDDDPVADRGRVLPRRSAGPTCSASAGRPAPRSPGAFAPPARGRPLPGPPPPSTTQSPPRIHPSVKVQSPWLRPMSAKPRTGTQVQHPARPVDPGTVVAHERVAGRGARGRRPPQREREPPGGHHRHQAHQRGEDVAEQEEVVAGVPGVEHRHRHRPAARRQRRSWAESATAAKGRSPAWCTLMAPELVALEGAAI